MTLVWTMARQASRESLGATKTPSFSVLAHCHIRPILRDSHVQLPLRATPATPLQNESHR